MPVIFSEAQILNFHKRYMAGESSVDISRAIGCHSSTLRNRWKRMGLAVRDGSGSMLLRMSKTSDADRRKLVAGANRAAKGRRAGFDELCRRAASTERFVSAMPDTEATVWREILQHGNVVRQKAFGPYNVDFCVGYSIAVEVYGGNWHQSGRHAARHPERTRYLLNRGLHVVVIWLAKAGECDAGIQTLHNLIADLKLAGSDPAAPRQYRVIGSDGNVIHAGDANDSDFPSKPAGKLGRDSKGRYFSA